MLKGRSLPPHSVSEPGDSATLRHILLAAVIPALTVCPNQPDHEPRRRCYYHRLLLWSWQASIWVLLPGCVLCWEASPRLSLPVRTPLILQGPASLGHFSLLPSVCRYD